MKANQLSDAEILEALRGNNPQAHNAALRQLYDSPVVNAKLQEMVRTFAYKADADDVLQNGIILLNDMMRDGRFRGESAITTFLISVCRNLIRNQVRTGERIVLKEEVKESDITESYLNNPENEPFRIEELGDDLQKRDKILRGLIGQLRERCQEVLELFYFTALNRQQIADQIGLKDVAQVATNANKCRNELRALIEHTPALKQFFKTNLHSNF
ncbi:MAG: sigma-70 family RNA polymerase sigma factor [Saprospiraceae bacterium]|nr:sigma-70 family RNA polymerase sigma factor [Saprospiraceae bacterium]